MLSKEYIVGLTDGEGSFTVYLRPPSRKYQAKHWRVECHYYLKLRKLVNKKLHQTEKGLEKIKDLKNRLHL